jgi:amino acid adenylation domain-containing protein/non-ribosomal peptide synthase protein (TIGR01720 family)
MNARPSESQTLVQLLRRRAIEEPDRQAYVYLSEGGHGATSITYGELDRAARGVAAHLQQTRTPGERAALLHPPGLEYVVAFFGCVYAGLVPGPLAPPRIRGAFASCRPLLADSGATCGLTTRAIMPAGVDDGIDWWIPEDGTSGDPDEWRDPGGTGASLAYLQYTSGSTSVPKGVMISLRNVLYNLEYIDDGFAHSRDSVSVSWLPHFHDMGLIYGILQPLYNGFLCVLMSPASFVRQPLRWLETISRYAATHSGGPNFAYDYCLRKIAPDQALGLDLSSWQIAFNGAEPVRADTLERFADTFAPYGFRREAFYPAFGLAEAGLKVSGGRFGGASQEPTDMPLAMGVLDRRRVGCGRASCGTRLVIVDPATDAPMPEGETGEIWVSGPGVAQGYWNRPEETRRVFGAYRSDTGDGPYLRTGDLGFVDGGQLFVTGRVKDLIIVRGTNYYPEDIEAAVQDGDSRLRRGSGAAFAVDDGGEERLVVVFELERGADAELEAVAQAVRRAVSERFELEVYAVALIAPGTLPRTSSGKVRRFECRARFLEQRLDLLGSSVLQPGAATGASSSTLLGAELVAASADERARAAETYLRDRLSRLIGVAPAAVDVTRPLIALGLDSLKIVELSHRIENDLGILVSTADLRERTAGDLVPMLCGRRERPAPPAPPVEGADAREYPLSRGQHALWVLHTLAPASTAYIIARAVRLRSRVDPAALERALRILSDRHAALRTTLREESGDVVQRIGDGGIEFTHESAQASDEADFAVRLDAAAHRPFDLERGPVARVTLFTRSDHEHVLLISVHHIVADYWALETLLHELSAVYTAELAGRPSPLLPLPAGYGEFVSWQARMLATGEGERHLMYWKTHLAGAPATLDLPMDRPRPRVQGYEGRRRPVTLGAAMTRRVHELARRHQVTPYTILLAALQTLLHRYTGQADILVGSPMNGRSRAAFADVVGYFANLVVMRGTVSGADTFAERIAQTGRSVQGAHEHGDYPFDLLIDRLGTRRASSHAPLVQVAFVLQNDHLSRDGHLVAVALGAVALGAGASATRLGDLHVESFPLEQRGAQFDLTVTLGEVDGALTGFWEYDLALFDAATIDRMARHFRNLLEAVTIDDTLVVGRIPLLDEAEERQLLIGWNSTEREFPRDARVHTLCEAQTVKTPDVVALVFEESHVTYAAMNARANQVAHQLRSLGVGPEVLVGLCVERSLDMVVGLLAILKAGGAYVPMEPTDPAGRLARIAGRARLRHVLTQERHRPHVPAVEHVVCLDAEGGAITERSTSNPGHADVGSDNLVYVIFTSGSTGEPKGAMNAHRGVCNRLFWMQDQYALGARDSVLQKTPFTFDVSVWEFFWPLLVGARLVIARPGGHQDCAYLRQCIRDEGISTLHFVPSMLRLFLEEPGLDDLRSLKRVFCSGEALSAELQSSYFDRLEAPLYNLYGPTEAAVDVTHHTCEPESTRATVPIGHPIANLRIHLLSPQLLPVPTGVAGELYIGGVGVGRGYVHDPALTAERFVPDPCGTGPGERLYKTGDVARYRPDGSVEYLGRLDFQVKLHGVRIELPEIETVLARYPAVRESAVTVQRDGDGSRLVAYVVPRGDEIAVAEIRAFLGQHLPASMIPSAYVSLPSMPLMPNGKLDRRALPPFEAARDTRPPAFVAPGTAAEHALASIWAEVLRVDRVGLHDNFVELGGDSISAIRIAAKARSAGLTFTAGDVLSHASVAALAAALQDGSSIAAWAPSAPGPLPLTPIQRWFDEQQLPLPHHYNQSLLLEAQPRLTPAVLERAIAALMEHHGALRLRFERNGSLWHQRQAAVDANRVFTRIDLSRLAGAEEPAARTAMLDLHRSLDLSNGPLLRVALFHRGGDRLDQLLFVVHHLATDGVSWGVLLEDLAAACRQAGGGGPVRLPSQTAPFSAWGDRLVRHAQTPAVEAEVPFWLARPWPVSTLPKDSAGGRNIVAVASVVTAALGRSETTALRNRAGRDFRCGMDELLLAALARALTQWMDAATVLVDIEGHGRDESQMGVDVSRTVGWFTTIHPVPLTALGEESSRDTLARVKETVRAVPNRGVGYGLLRYLRGDLDVARTLRERPQAEVCFNYLGAQPDAGADAPFRVVEGLDLVRAPSQQRPYLLEIDGALAADELRVQWRYSPEIHHPATIARVIGWFCAELRAFLTLPAGAEHHTPADFPMAKLSQQDLQRFVAELSQPH